MSTSGEEREGTSCRLREQQIAAFLWMEMNGHRTLNPSSPLRLQNSPCTAACLLVPGEAPHSVVTIARWHMGTFTSG